MQGAQFGKLMEVLHNSSELTQGSDGGRLDEVEVLKLAVLEQLRQQACDALLQGAQSGKLLEVLHHGSALPERGQPDEVEKGSRLVIPLLVCREEEEGMNWEA